MANNADKVSESAGIDVSPEKLMKEIKPLLDQLAKENLAELIELFNDVVAKAKEKKPLAANTTMPGTTPGDARTSAPSIGNPGAAQF